MSAQVSVSKQIWIEDLVYSYLPDVKVEFIRDDSETPTPAASYSPKRKTISIFWGSGTEKRDVLDVLVLVLHEVSHALGSSGHGRDWQVTFRNLLLENEKWRFTPYQANCILNESMALNLD